MSEVKQRVIEFCGYKQISVRQFEINCGFSNGYISRIKNLTQKALNTMLSVYPEINASWITAGIGSMLNEYNKMEEYKEEIARLNRIVESQQQTIYNLSSFINSR